MRLWHYQLLPYLPDAQLKGQWRECGLIAKDILEKGKPNHLLVNRISNYPIEDFSSYCFLVYLEMKERGFKVTLDALQRIENVCGKCTATNIFKDWHNAEYLRVCMANLYEKFVFGVGKSKITLDDWCKLDDGYRTIARESYHI